MVTPGNNSTFLQNLCFYLHLILARNMTQRQMVINQKLILQRRKLHSKNHMTSSGHLNSSFQAQVKCSWHSANTGTRTRYTSLDPHLSMQQMIHHCVHLSCKHIAPKVKVPSSSAMFELNIFTPQNRKPISSVVAGKLLSFICSVSWSSSAPATPPMPTGHNYFSGASCGELLSLSLWLWEHRDYFPASGPLSSRSPFLSPLLSHCPTFLFQKLSKDVLGLHLAPTLRTNSPFSWINSAS